jgi:hypothetical protein
VIVLSPIEFGEGLDIRVDPAFLLPTILGRFGQPPLLAIVKKDRGSVLTGKGRGSGVVSGPEHVEQLRVRDDFGIVVDLDRLRIIPDSLVGRILSGASGVSDPGPNDPGQLPKLGIRSPESP